MGHSVAAAVVDDDDVAVWLPDILNLTHGRAPELTLNFIQGRSNELTRATYLRILKTFLEWAERSEVDSLARLSTADVSNYIKGLQRSSAKKAEPLSPRTRAQTLACLRGYFDALVRGGALATNPAASVEPYKTTSKIGHAQPLSPEDMARLLDSIDATTLTGLQDRAMIALMGYSCARVGAVIKMKLGSLYEKGGRLHVRLSEKRGAIHYVPCHPDLEAYLNAFLERASTVGDCLPNPEKWLFRRWDKKQSRLTGKPLTRIICYSMVKKRALALGLENVTNHSFRATGITTFLQSGGALDDARRLQAGTRWHWRSTTPPAAT